MPWPEYTRMDARTAVIAAALEDEQGVTDLALQVGVSRKTIYKWLHRVEQGEGLVDRSRRPHHSPRQTSPQVEAAVVAVREQHPSWSGRKIAAWLRATEAAEVPSPSTITEILRRHNLLTESLRPQRDLQRFEHAAPNMLWQIDFKGPLTCGAEQVSLLAILDDHSRFLPGLYPCLKQHASTVKQRLIETFRTYGMPMAVLTDNGPPWGTSGMGGITHLEAWLLRLDIAVRHGRFYHPQTQGKVERFFGTVQRDLLTDRQFTDVAAFSTALADYRDSYNHERPHQALADAVPASRYTVSPRPYAEQLPPIVYLPGDRVLTVRGQGAIVVDNHSYFVSRGLIGEKVAVRPTTTDGVLAVYFCQHEVTQIDLRQRTKV